MIKIMHNLIYQSPRNSGSVVYIHTHIHTHIYIYMHEAELSSNIDSGSCTTQG